MNTPAAEEKAAPSLESPKPAQPTAEPVAATEKNAVLSSDSARPSAEPAAVNAPALEKKTDPPKPEQSPTSGEPAIPGAKEEK
jgi:hypothetical protein